MNRQNRIDQTAVGEIATKYIVFVEALGDTTTRVKCYRDSEHDTRAAAYTRLQAVLPFHPGRLVWIETATRCRSPWTSDGTWRCPSREIPTIRGDVVVRARFVGTGNRRELEAAKRFVVSLDSFCREWIIKHPEPSGDDRHEAREPWERNPDWWKG